MKEHLEILENYNNEIKELEKNADYNSEITLVLIFL